MFSGSPASQQAVCPGGKLREEEQEAAAEATEEHGSSQCGAGATADPLREGATLQMNAVLLQNNQEYVYRT